MRFGKRLQSTFLAGIFTVLPIVVTAYLLVFVYQRFKGFLLPYIRMAFDFFAIHIEVWIQEIISSVLLVIIILMIGVFAKNFLGKKVIKMVDGIATRIPMVRGIYNATKQIVEAFSSADGSNFKKVVLVEYPRQGIYSIGFVTKDTSNFFNCMVDAKCYNIFIPTTPNPTSGFILIVPKADVKELPMTVEEGIKFVISAGLVNPYSNDDCESVKHRLDGIEADGSDGENVS